MAKAEKKVLNLENRRVRVFWVNVFMDDKFIGKEDTTSMDIKYKIPFWANYGTLWTNDHLHFGVSVYTCISSNNYWELIKV